VDLVALRIVGQDLLEEKLRPALIVEVIVPAPAFILISHGPPVQLIGLGYVELSFEGRRWYVQLQTIGLLENAVELNQFLLRPSGALMIANLDIVQAELFERDLVFAACSKNAFDFVQIGRRLPGLSIACRRSRYRRLGRAEGCTDQQTCENAKENPRAGHGKPPCL